MAKRKLSGMTGVELSQSLTSLSALIKKARWHKDAMLQVSEDDRKEDPEMEEQDIKQLEGIYEMLQEKAQRHQSFSFSSITEDQLAALEFSFVDVIDLKPEPELDSLKAVFSALGNDGLWSLDRLCEHLQLIQDIAPNSNGAVARLSVNAFFYRVVSTKPPGSSMIINVEQCVPSATLLDSSLHTVAGAIDWTLISTSPAEAARFLRQPLHQILVGGQYTLFVSEGKRFRTPLEDEVPQVIAEMASCARTTKQTTIRGVLTNGRQWLFLILTLGEQGGGKYYMSKSIETFAPTEDGIAKLKKGLVALVCGILAHWVQNSHCELGDDDFFTYPLI